MTVKFRDILSAKVTVNGAEAEWSGGAVSVPVTVGQEKIVIELTDWIPLTNPDHKEMETDLLTRVQWPNSRKNRLFKKENYEKLPGWLKDALAEIDAME